MKLGYHRKKEKEHVKSVIDKKIEAIKSFLSRRKRPLISLTIFLVLCITAFFVIRDSDLKQIIYFNKVSSKSLDRLSEDAFRKIIGFDYGEKIYAKDTAIIRSRLEESDMILGDVQFSLKYLPREFDIKFNEAKPLFVLMPQNVVYSDKGKLYPYNVNIADLPIVEINKNEEVHLATSFLNEMKKNDATLYSRVSQVFPCEDKSQIVVFFNEVNFKTKFSLEDDYWKMAFRHYRQLTRNMRVSNLDSVSILDLRFRKLAYTSTNGGSDGC